MSVAVVLGGLAGGMWLIQAGRLARKTLPFKDFVCPAWKNYRSGHHE